MRILRGLSSSFLSCGCLAGVYETYDGEIVRIIDARGESCVEPAHVRGKVAPVPESGPVMPRRRSPSSHE
jgi:hypothetical protein